MMSLRCSLISRSLEILSAELPVTRKKKKVDMCAPAIRTDDNFHLISISGLKLNIFTQVLYSFEVLYLGPLLFLRTDSKSFMASHSLMQKRSDSMCL